MKGRSSPFALTLLLVAASCAGSGDDGHVTASGHVEATEVRLATKVAGRVEEIDFEEGAQVRAGQQVARLDSTDAELLLAQARAERGQAEAELRLRIAGPRHEEIASARSTVASLEADLDGAERELDRMQALLDKASGTEKARDDARTRRDSLAGRLGAARQSVALLEAGSRREEIDAARARVAAADARIAQLERQIADGRVTSPLDAVLTEKLVEPGEWVPVGAVLAVLSDLARPWLTVYVDEPDLSRVRLGQEAEVVTDDGRRRTGRVGFIASTAEFTPKNVQTRDERAKLVFKVKIELDNDDGLFKPGMPAQATFAAETRP